MLTSILRESSISVQEVETELQALTPAPKNAARNLAILAVSLLLFVLLGTVDAGPRGITVVVMVVLIHELGHLAAMRIFGYRDMQMFFIPLFGAAVSGTETNPSGARRAIVALSGPAPGIALGVICTMLFHATDHAVFKESARTFLLLNTFNLLPLVPLDGGRFVEAVLFSRTPALRALFSLAAGIALALIALVARDFLFGVLAVLVLGTVKGAYSTGHLVEQIKREVQEHDVPSVEYARIPSQYIERLIPLLEQRLPEQLCTPAGIAAAVRNIWHMVWFRLPSAVVSVLLLLLYVAVLAAGIVATIGAELSFQETTG